MKRAVSVGIGIARYPFEQARDFFRWVELCEDSDIDSLWQTDRLASSQPYLESLSVMAALAGATQRLKFGMNAVVVSLRDPLLLAKQCATIDHLSGGRLLPVFGVGSDVAPEWKAAGFDPKGRGRRADEALTLMRRLWSEDEVSFEGEFYRYEKASISPRPMQKELPLWIGGSSKAAIRRTAALGTGWLAGIQSPAQVAPVISGIHAELARVGRSIDADHYGAGFPFRFGSWDDPLPARIASGPAGAPTDTMAVGDTETILERIAEYRHAGVSKFVLIPLADGVDDLLDQTRRLIAEVVPIAHSWQ